MKKLPVKERATLEAATKRLYLMDPVLFQIFCALEQRENTAMRCIARFYKGVIEYNPNALEYIDNWLLFEELANVLCRVALNHTNERKPEGVSNLSLSIASDMVMHGFYNFTRKKLHGLGQYPEGQDLVWYAYRVQNDHNMHRKKQPSSGDDGKKKNDDNETPHFTCGTGGSGSPFGEEGEQSGDGGAPNPNPEKGDGQQDSFANGRKPGDKESDKEETGGGRSPEEEEKNKEQRGLSDRTLSGDADENALRDFCDGWEEDPYLAEKVKQYLQDAILGGNSWGNITGNGVERLKASLEPKVNYRDMLAGFKTSIIKSDRVLTRMKPNRRTGFLNMGSKREMKSRLLIAIDTSGSVSSESLVGFYSIINGIFKFGGADVDTVQFDYEVTTPIKPLKHADKQVEIQGRGGTNFQAAIDYVCKHKLNYDGILYFTDGYAPLPERPAGFHTKLMWLFDSKSAYNDLKQKIHDRGLGRSAWMDLQTEIARVNLL